MGFILHNMPAYFYIKDERSHYVAISQSIERDWGVKQERLLGYSDYETPWDIFADHYMNCDNMAKECGSSDVFEPLPLNSNNIVTARSIKFPIKDEAGKVLGVIGQTQFLSFHPNLNEALLALLEKDRENYDLSPQKNLTYQLSQYPQSFQFTPRESQCLFLLARGKTAKEIGLFLNISFRTVETYIEHIKLKLGVSNRSQIIAKVLEHGILDIIPKKEMLFHLYNRSNKLKQFFE